MFKFSFICFLLCLNIWALGQNKISGRVIDNVTKEPLAFVNIVYNNSNQGTTTDLDGYFFIESSIPVKTLYLSYIGYNKDTVNIVEGKKYLELSLNPEIAQLNEVVVLPGVNPAHRIINSVVENKKLNSPESLESFAYTSYNKFYATIDLADIPIVDTSSLQTDSIAINREASDTVPDSTVNRLNRAKNLLDKQYFLLMESVSERKFKHPDKNSEIVIANRISGLQNPMFFMLATQMQSFSFYEEHITLYDKEYLNPISKGSTDKYFFLLTDTIYTEQFDTVFIITFRPRKGKNFDGLEGTLHINSNKYALQHVLASPAEQGSLFSIQIQQKYEYIQNKQWFPVQLNTNFTFQSLNVSIDGYNAPLKGIGKSYINNIMINPEFENKLFDHIVVSTEKNAHKKDEEFWNKYRPDSLSIKEKNTYQVIDSLGDEANIDEKIAMLEVIATGQIPIGFMNIDLSKLMWYNNYEGYRLGLGINTNQKLLKWCALGIYGAYGFRDKAFKYGGNIDFSIWKAAEFHFGALYRNDIEISDNYNFLWTSSFLSTELYRDFLLTEFDPIETYEAYAELRMLRYLKTRVVFNYNSRNISNFQRYYYEDVPLDENGLMQYYQAEISAKYAFKEKFIETPKGNKISMGTNWPVLWLNASYGFIGNLSGDTFLKIQSQVDKKFTINALGDMSIRLTAGFADNNTPYSMLYKGYGSYSWLDAGNTFNTMRVNEFISDRFVHAFIKHDFGSLLFRTKKWRPEIAVLTNIGWSTWSRGAIPTGYIGPYNKWYFESGLQFNYLLRATFIGYGFGAYYRYGAYHLPDLIDNFAFKLTLTYDF